MKIKNVLHNPSYYVNKCFFILKNHLRSQFYRGNKVICQLCHWEGTQFFDSKCPKCYSLPRTRILAFSLDYFKLGIINSKLLNIGPNKNEFKFIKSKINSILNYDRIDIINYSHINLLQDITNSNLLDQSYDLVIAWHVLEHIPNDKAAISEVYRILKQGGHFLVSVPIYPKGNPKTFEDHTMAYADFERVHGHYDHCRSCGLDYYQRFEAAGFQTETLSVSALDPNTIVRFGLQEDHVVWCFTK